MKASLHFMLVSNGKDCFTTAEVKGYKLANLHSSGHSKSAARKVYGAPRLAALKHQPIVCHVAFHLGISAPQAILPVG